MAATTHFTDHTNLPGMLQNANGWSAGIAILFGALGLVAILEPIVAGLSLALAVGSILVLAGFVNAFSAQQADGVSRVVWQAIVATIYFVSGLYFLLHPALGLRALTLLLAGVLFCESASEVVAFAQAPRDRGAMWLLVNGIATSVLGMMILAQWPSSAAWAIGTLLGLNLLMTGVARLIEGAPVTARAV